MRDSLSKIIYAGKANDLRKRVSSYFRDVVTHPKISAMLASIQQIDYIATASERDALLLEQKVIHRFQPIYNTMWRDDKSYPYIQLTKEDYPRLVLTRQKKKDGSKYFGPYPNVTFAKKFLRMLWRKKLLPLRPCRYPFAEKDIAREGGLKTSQPILYRKVRSCMYLHTGECPAPCVSRISAGDYRRIARNAELFFKGEIEPLKYQLGKDMRAASEARNYEKAALLRDQIAAMDHVSEKIVVRKVDEDLVETQVEISRALRDLQDHLQLPSPPVRIEAFDISNTQSTEPVASMVVFENGKPLKSDYRKFKIRTVTGQDDFAMMSEVVFRRYLRVLREDGKKPDLILIDGGKGQLSAALAALGRLPEAGIAKSAVEHLRVASLAKQDEEVFLPGRAEPLRLSKDSPALHVLQAVRDEAHRFAVTFHRQRRAKAAFSGPADRD